MIYTVVGCAVALTQLVLVARHVPTLSRRRWPRRGVIAVFLGIVGHLVLEELRDHVVDDFVRSIRVST